MTRILLVEDEPRNRETLDAVLSAEGFAVETAATLSEARAKLAIVPDLVVLDLGLPDGRGSDLVPEIRATGARVVILTGDPEAASAEPGVDGTFGKGEDVALLLNMLHLLSDLTRS